METKKEKLQSEFCIEEFRIIIQLRLKLLATRLGRSEDSPVVVTGSNITQAGHSTSDHSTDHARYLNEELGGSES